MEYYKTMDDYLKSKGKTKIPLEKLIIPINPYEIERQEILKFLYENCM